jgi:hypothetical protein
MRGCRNRRITKPINTAELLAVVETLGRPGPMAMPAPPVGFAPAFGQSAPASGE